MPALSPAWRLLCRAPLLCALLAPGLAQAQPAPNRPRGVESQRLGWFNLAEQRALAPHLSRGPVALVEFARGEALPAILFAMDVEAPASAVVQLLGDPRAYPRFMPALDSVSVQQRNGATTAYEWTWRVALFTLRGQNVMTVYPPRGRGTARPWRIETVATGGDLGRGRVMWRIYPRGAERCRIVLSSRLDLRNANYVTQQVNQGQRTINRTINIALAAVMVLGTRQEAERRAGVAPRTPGPLPGLRRPSIEAAALGPLLARGDLLLFDMTGSRVDQITVVGRPGAARARVRQVMTDPREFGPALVPGAYARIASQTADHVDFDWGVDIPLIGTSGTMRLRERGSVVEIDALSGALAHGRWRFDTVGMVQPIVIGWARFDPADANWLIGMLVQGNAFFGYGIAAGSQIMLMRALRSRALRRDEARR